MSGAGRAELVELSAEEREIAALLVNCESREPIAQAALLLQRAAFMADDVNVVVDLIDEELSDLLCDPSLSHRAATGGRILNDRDAAMLGARWLLHVGQYSFEDARRDTGLALLRAPQYPNGTAHFKIDDHALAKQTGNVSVRQHIAFYCLKRALQWSGQDFASPRHHLRVRGKEFTAREAFVAQHLTQAIYARLARLETDEPFRAEREIAWVRLGLILRESGSTGASNNRNDSSRSLQSLWIQHGEQLASHLDRSPRYYPTHLPPTVLAKLLTLVQDHGEGVHSDARYAAMSLADLGSLCLGRRAAILGDPGAGKSTLLQAYGATVLRSEADRDVVFVRLVDYAAEAVSVRPTDAEAIARILAKCGLRQFQTEPAKRDIEGLAQVLRDRGEALLLLDGLDEVLDPHGRAHIEQLIDQLPEFAASVVLTSRPDYFSPRTEWERYRIDGSSNLFGRLIELWWPGDEYNLSRDIARAAVEDSPHLGALSYEPFYAGLIALVASRKEYWLEPDQHIDTSTATFMEAAVRLILDREWKHPVQALGINGATEAESILSACEHAAWVMAVGDPVAPNPERFTVGAPRRDLVALSVDVEQVLKSDLFTADIREYGVAKPWQRVRWVHRTFQDYFVGTRLASQWVSNRDDVEWLVVFAIQMDQWVGSIGIMLESLSLYQRSEVVRAWEEGGHFSPNRRSTETTLENIVAALGEPARCDHNSTIMVVRALVDADRLVQAYRLCPNFLNVVPGALPQIGENIAGDRFKAEQLLRLPDDVARRIAVTYRMCADNLSTDLPLAVAERIEALLSRPTNGA